MSIYYGKIKISGGSDTLSVKTNYLSGTNIATIKINNDLYDIYTPCTPETWKFELSNGNIIEKTIYVGN